MRVLVEPDAEGVSRTAAGLVRQTLLANPHATLALPTGRTPLGLYRELLSTPLDFSNCTIFNLDEYIGIPPTDPRSFHAYLTNHFLSRVNIAPGNIHLLSHDSDATACADYEKTIRSAGGIDLLIAGVGTNGHIAFNEPGSALDSRTRIVKLAPSTRASMRAVFQDDEVPTHAVTMGLGTILEARKILVLAAGQTKEHAMAGLLHRPVTTENPVSAVRLHSDVTVIADEEAGGRALSGSSHKS